MNPDVRFKFNPQVNTFKSLSQTLFYRPENPNLKRAHIQTSLLTTGLHCAYDLGLGVSALDRILKKTERIKDLIESSKDRI